jgi:LPPG:FO 2-phospho-L-lactate transferase
MIVALAGGVGGAKLADGLYRALPAHQLTVIVNTADDLDLFGLRICPDLDTVMYTLAGIANPLTGWGIRDDSFAALEMLGRYGRPTWFRLGDRDLATHVARTERLRAGAPLSAVTAELAAALGIQATLLPMSDAPVATRVQTPVGTLDFQDYFVRLHQAETVTGVVFDGIERARPPAAALRALTEAEAVILCPSNPIVSIGPILAVPGLRDAVARHPGPRVAVSPIVAGRALRGPADRMLESLGHEVSAYGVAALYRGLIDGMVIDEADAALAPRIEGLGMRVLVAPTVMGNPDDRVALAARVLAFCQQIRRGVG